MNGTFFYIGLGLGLAAAAGLRPFLPALLAGGLGAAGALGVSFAAAPYRFLQSDWWLLVIAVTLALAYVLQLPARPRAHGRSQAPSARGPTRSPRRSPAWLSARAHCCSRVRSPRTATSGGPG